MISKCLIVPSGRSETLHRTMSVDTGAAESRLRLKGLQGHAAFRPKRPRRRSFHTDCAGGDGGVFETRRRIPSTAWMYADSSAARSSAGVACHSSPWYLTYPRPPAGIGSAATAASPTIAPTVGFRRRISVTLYTAKRRKPPKAAVGVRRAMRKKIWYSGATTNCGGRGGGG